MWIVRDILRYLSISSFWGSGMTGFLSILFVLHAVVHPILGIMILRKKEEENWLNEVRTALYFIILPPIMAVSFFLD